MFTIASAVSLVLCLVAVVLWVRSYWVAESWYGDPSTSRSIPDPAGNPVKFDHQWHVSLAGGGLVLERIELPAGTAGNPGRHLYPLLHLRGLRFPLFTVRWHGASFEPGGLLSAGSHGIRTRISLFVAILAVMPAISLLHATRVQRRERVGKCRR